MAFNSTVQRNPQVDVEVDTYVNNYTCKCEMTLQEQLKFTIVILHIKMLCYL